MCSCVVERKWYCGIWYNEKGDKMEIWDERIGPESVLDKLSIPVCGSYLLGNCHNECLLEVYGDEKVILIFLSFIGFYKSSWYMW